MESRLAPKSAEGMLKKSGDETVITLNQGVYLIIIKEEKSASVSTVTLEKEEAISFDSKNLKLLGNIKDVKSPEKEIIAIKLK